MSKLLADPVPLGYCLEKALGGSIYIFTDIAASLGVPAARILLNIRSYHCSDLHKFFSAVPLDRIVARLQRFEEDLRAGLLEESMGKSISVPSDPQMWIGGLFLLWYALCMIYLAADHRGFQLKEALKKFLGERGVAFEDVGALAYDKGDDYVDFAAAAAAKIAASPSQHRGIFICGSGQGMDIVANKFKGIRAALCWNTREAEQSRRDDDANVLVLAADAYDEAQTQGIVSVWLATPFSGEERHVRRLKKIEELEEKNFK